eukprot:scpid70699/ scgid30400/ 
MLFGCPTRRAKHAKNSMITDWISDSYRGEDDRSLSQFSTASSSGLGSHRTRKAKVLQTYKAQLANEMSVTEGEIIHILHHAKSWAYVINSEGQKGYIPYTYCGESQGTFPRHSMRSATHSTVNTGAGHAAVKRSQNNGNIASQPDWEQYGNGGPNMPRRHKTDDNISVYSMPIDNLDLADTLSLRSSMDPELGKRLGSGVYMADILPFFKVPYGRSVVLFDFNGEEENDLHVERGTDVTVLNQDDPGWLWVRTDDKREGFIPRTYICQCGCTSIHEQIVESLQETMQRQEELHMEQERALRQHQQKQQLRQQYPEEDIIEEAQESDMADYPEYDYARFQSADLPHKTTVKQEKSGNQEAHYSVQKEAEAYNGKPKTTYATVVPKAERNKLGKDDSWDSDTNPRIGPHDLCLRITNAVTGPSEVNYLDVDVNDYVYVTEENLQIGKGSGWLFVYSPDVDRYGYVPESAVQSQK